MTQDPNEKLLRALGDIGGDLIDRAETASFRTGPWRRWGALAACMALVVCISVVALPQLMTGKGAVSQEKAEAPAYMADKSTAATESKTESAPAEPAPEMEEGAAEEMKETQEEQAQDVQKDLDVCVRQRIVFRHTYYYLLPPDPETVHVSAKELGSVIGKVEDAENEQLIGCTIVEAPYTTQFTNHAVNGLAVPQEILVLTPDGWSRGVTNNEKTVSRYTLADVEAAMAEGDDQWLLTMFVAPVERIGKQPPSFTDASVLTSDQLNQLFLATLTMNTGVNVSDFWLYEDASLLVPAEDVQWRLDRFLEGHVYDAAASDAAVNDGDALLIPAQEYLLSFGGAQYLQLLEADLTDNILTLHLYRYEDGNQSRLLAQRVYTIRFDEDSWRYLSIVTIGS